MRGTRKSNSSSMQERTQDQSEMGNQKLTITNKQCTTWFYRQHSKASS